MVRRSASEIDRNMDELLEQMAVLADEAGDWRGHLPYAAAAGFRDNPRYWERYGAHVDECRYCQGLVEALHPSEGMLDKLLSQVDAVPLSQEGLAHAAEGVAEARWYLDQLREVMVAQPQSGALRTWVNLHQWLIYADQRLEGPGGSLSAPWEGTVSLSLDTPPNPKIGEMDVARLGDVMVDFTSFLISFGFRVAHAGDPRSGSISKRICDLASAYGRRRVPTPPSEESTIAPEMEFGVSGYCAWPVHIGAPVEEVEAYEANFGQQGIVKWLTLEGESRPYSFFAHADRRHPKSEEWAHGLRTLRNAISHESLACIVMGGSAIMDRDAIGSVTQDALSALRDQRPLYVLGGFGGCARDIATVLQLTEVQPEPHRASHTVANFSAYIGSDRLRNGLDAAENRTLAETGDVEEAARLVVLGLKRVGPQQRNWR